MNTDKQVCEKVELASEIFDKYGNMIWAVIYLNLNDTSYADDIYQNFFLSLVRKPVPTYIQNIKAYLYKAVRHDILDLVKMTKNYRIRIQKYGKYHMSLIKNRKPQDILIEQEEIEKLFELIEKHLSAHENRAVTQRYRYDLNVTEAAKEMNINKRSYSRYLSVALRKTRKYLNEQKSCKCNA